MPDTDRRPLLLTNARLVDPASATEQKGGVLIEGGIIRDLGPGLVASAVSDETHVHDCHGAVVAPGLVDLRVHVGEPGAEDRETLRTLSQAAAAGGVTTVVTMPDTDPAVDEPAIVDFVLRRARATASIRVHPAAALTKGLAGKEMTEIGLLLEAGAVAFTDATRSVMNAQVLRRALGYGSMFNALVMQHLEEPTLVGEGVVSEGEFASRMGLPGVPREAETIVLERDMRLVRMTGGRYHASVVTCPDSLDVLARAKAAGLPVTAGTSINHLSLNENDIGEYRTFLKLAPPLRTEDERLALVAALADGLIDVIVSDHNPQDVEAKRQPFVECANGAVGVETMLAAGLRLVHSGHVSLTRLLNAMSTRPAELIGVPGGRLERGAPGDVIVFDPDMPWVVDAEKLHSRCRNTPFDEARMSGKVLMTIVAGRVVYEAG
ncbi:MAG TPA: dihydroorotase [Beijerinckiaceae bacterium]|nr:dihydroorotase [Beijerinckiaceae bacterium]